MRCGHTPRFYGSKMGHTLSIYPFLLMHFHNEYNHRCAVGILQDYMDPKFEILCQYVHIYQYISIRCVTIDARWAYSDILWILNLRYSVNMPMFLPRPPLPNDPLVCHRPDFDVLLEYLAQNQMVFAL